MEMMIEVNVELLCTKTVPNIPSISPTMGFARNGLSPLKKVPEQKYRHHINCSSFILLLSIYRLLCLLSIWTILRADPKSRWKRTIVEAPRDISPRSKILLKSPCCLDWTLSSDRITQSIRLLYAQKSSGVSSLAPFFKAHLAIKVKGKSPARNVTCVSEKDALQLLHATFDSQLFVAFAYDRTIFILCFLHAICTQMCKVSETNDWLRYHSSGDQQVFDLGVQAST